MDLRSQSKGLFNIIENTSEDTIIQDFERLLAVEDSQLIVDAVGTLEVLLHEYLQSHGFKLETHTYDVIKENGYFKWYYLGKFNYIISFGLGEISLPGKIEFGKYRNDFWLKIYIKDELVYQEEKEKSSFLGFPIVILSIVRNFIFENLKLGDNI